ncbi:MAG TPA: glycosyltransferase family 39 protein [Tepidisphaeraceae bacterium]|nr:glycosyltransferase family 39 protein [Tepidisphaeraceae bacterium]
METKSRRGCYAVLAGLLTLAFLVSVECYAIPATLGGDRNAYLLGGKMLAAGRFAGITPPDPYVYLGPNWVMPEPGRFVLKYPLGLPLIYAIIRLIAGPGHWIAVAHQLSPIAASLAVLGTFYLLRPLVGSRYALLGMLLVATSPVNFYYANLPNSHAPALCMAVWGMTLLFDWWRRGGTGRAIAAGFLLGCNFTIRYSEGLLILPLILIWFFRTGGQRREIFRSLALPMAWAFPVAGLLAFNFITIGHANGYGLTHESTGFAVSYFCRNWQVMASELYQNTILFLFPVIILGAVISLVHETRISLVFWIWSGVTVMTYTSYYWIPGADETDMRYVRFVLTVLPALAWAAVWLLRQCADQFGRAGTIGSLAMVGISSVMNLRAALPHAEQLYHDDRTYRAQQKHVLAHIPAGSVIFADEPTLAPMDAAGDWRLYSSELFTPHYVRSHAAHDPDAPQMMQVERAQRLSELLGGQSSGQLVDQQNRLIENARANGRHVYVVLSHDGCAAFCSHFKLQPSVVDRWDIDGRQMEIDEVEPISANRRSMGR